MSLDCPHCGTENAAFQIVSERLIETLNRKAFSVFLFCRVCEGGAVVNLAIPSKPAPSPMQCTPDPILLDYKLLAMWPEPTSTKAPDHTPDHIASFFVQAEENLPKNYDAAGAMYRKALDTATLNIDPSLKGKNLYQRIEALADQFAITPAMRDWAHGIRTLGNDAVHEEEPFTEY